MINRESFFQRRLEITPKKQKTIKTINKTCVKGFLNEVRKKRAKIKVKTESALKKAFKRSFNTNSPYPKTDKIICL